MAVEDPVLPLASRLLDCLCEQLPDTVGGPVCQCCLRPGLGAPADLCCNCLNDGVPAEGQAWVRVSRIFPVTARFPQQQTDRQACQTGAWAAELELGVWRCAGVVDDDGTPPSCERVTRDTTVTLSDAAAMRRALRCCFTDADTLTVVGDWSPLGPNGGCVGGRMIITVEFSDCPCPG